MSEMAEIRVKNRLTHSSEGYAYSFRLSPDGELQVDGCTAETWLCIARSVLKAQLLEGTNIKTAAVLSYVDKALAAILNKPCEPSA